MSILCAVELLFDKTKINLVTGTLPGTVKPTIENTIKTVELRKIILEKEKLNINHKSQHIRVYYSMC